MLPETGYAKALALPNPRNSFLSRSKDLGRGVRTGSIILIVKYGTYLLYYMTSENQGKIAIRAQIVQGDRRNR